MTLRERLRADKETLTALDNHSKLLFIWDYYKLPILAVLLALVLSVMVLISWAGKKDIAMYAVLVNSDVSLVQTQPEMLTELLAAGGVDMEGKTIDITADLTLGQAHQSGEDGQTLQVLAALFGITGLDVFAADQASFDRYVAQDAFVDLSLFLEEALYQQPGCVPYWYENAEGRTVLGGVILQEGSALHRAGYYHADVVVGVAANAQNLEEAVTFVRQLLTAG